MCSSGNGSCDDTLGGRDDAAGVRGARRDARGRRRDGSSGSLSDSDSDRGGQCQGRNMVFHECDGSLGFSAESYGIVSGSGSGVLHVIVAGIGVVEGSTSDDDDAGV